MDKKPDEFFITFVITIAIVFILGIWCSTVIQHNIENTTVPATPAISGR